MGPLESLRRFQVSCGDVDVPTTTEANLLPPVPVEPNLTFVSFNEVPPDLPAPGTPTISVIPPVGPTPLEPLVPTTPAIPPPPSEVPEPSSLLLVLTGAGAAIEMARRKVKGHNAQ